MAVTRALTLRLDEDDYQRLEHEASRLGIGTGTLARLYVRTGLGADAAAAGAEQRRRSGAEALSRLAALRGELRRAGHAGVDAVTAAARARRELERRRTR